MRVWDEMITIHVSHVRIFLEPHPPASYSSIAAAVDMLLISFYFTPLQLLITNMFDYLQEGCALYNCCFFAFCSYVVPCVYYI